MNGQWMLYAGASLVAVALTALGAMLLTQPQSPLRIAWARYEAYLDREARFLLLKDDSGKQLTGRRLGRYHLFACLAMLVVPYAIGMLELYVLIPVVVFAPTMMLSKRHDERVLGIEGSLDAWLLMLSNALKATPSIGDAIESSTKLVRPPISEELEYMLKEIHLGTPFDKAVTNASERIGSRTVSTALATLLVGRQTGGDLPRILEESAATLREMARLEGVVRTKTAEGRSQATVLGAMPYFVVGALYALDPDWMEPLFTTSMGKLILFGAFCLWVGAIALALRILKVDI